MKKKIVLQDCSNVEPVDRWDNPTEEYLADRKLRIFEECTVGGEW